MAFTNNSNYTASYRASASNSTLALSVTPTTTLSGTAAAKDMKCAVVDDDNSDLIEEYQYIERSLYMKRILGVPLENGDLLAEDLVSYPQPGQCEPCPPNLNAAPSTISNFSEDAEYADLQFAYSILTSKNAVPKALVSSTAELPDGTLAATKQMNNAFFEASYGQPAFDGTNINPDLLQSFLDQACEISPKKHFISLADERKLNTGCHEQYLPQSRIWREDFEDFPIPLKKQPVIKELYRHGDSAKTFTTRLSVRDDLPLNPHHFTLTHAGRQAARALHAYQLDNEDNTATPRTPLQPYELPTMANNTPITHFPDPHAHLNANPGKNDWYMQCWIDTIHALHAHEAYYDFAAAHNPAQLGRCSGHPLDGHEDEVVLDIYNDLRGTPGKFTTEHLFCAGYIAPKDPFGDNPEHLYAKLLWWREKRGIDGIEAVVRYHFEKVRGVACPERMLSGEGERRVNLGSSSYALEPRVHVQVGPEVFEELHAAAVEYSVQAITARVGEWAGNGVVAPWEFLGHHCFVEDEGDVEGLVRTAYEALVVYQDSVEPVMDPREIPDWARPQWVEQEEGHGALDAVPATEDEEIVENQYEQTETINASSERKHDGMLELLRRRKVWKTKPNFSGISKKTKKRKHATKAKSHQMHKAKRLLQVASLSPVDVTWTPYIHKARLQHTTPPPLSKSKPSPPGLTVSPKQQDLNSARLSAILDTGSNRSPPFNSTPAPILPPGLDVSLDQQITNATRLSIVLDCEPEPELDFEPESTDHNILYQSDSSQNDKECLAGFMQGHWASYRLYAEDNWKSFQKILEHERARQWRCAEEYFRSSAHEEYLLNHFIVV